MNDVKLTEHERDGLDYAVHATDCNFDDVAEQVERIIAERLAPVLALADEWERDESRRWTASCGQELREAVSP